MSPNFGGIAAFLCVAAMLAFALIAALHGALDALGIPNLFDDIG